MSGGSSSSSREQGKHPKIVSFRRYTMERGAEAGIELTQQQHIELTKGRRLIIMRDENERAPGERTILLHSSPEDEGEEDAGQQQHLAFSLGNCWGLLLAIIAAAADALCTAIIQYLNFNLIQICLWEYIFLAIFPVPLVIWKNANLQEIWPLNTTFLLLLGQAALLSNAHALTIFALENIEMGDVAIVLSTTPVFVYILSALLLREKGGVVPYLLSALNVVGTLIVAHPYFLTGTTRGVDSLYGSLASFGAMLTTSTSIVIQRKIRQVHYAFMNFTFGVWGFLQFGLLGCFVSGFSMPSDTGLLLLFVAAICTFIGRSCQVAALAKEKSGPVALAMATRVIFAFCLQYIFFQRPPNVYDLMGTGLVLLAVVLIGLRKIVEDLSTENKYRKRLSFMLY